MVRLSKKSLKASRRCPQIPACVPKHFGRQEFADFRRVLIFSSLLLRKSAITCYHPITTITIIDPMKIVNRISPINRVLIE